VDLFRKNLATLQIKATSNTTDSSGRLIAMTQDLLILLLPYLSSADISTLFHTCLSPDVLTCKDNAVQKRGYKILQRIVDSGKIVVEAESVLRKLDELGDGLMPAAKKVISPLVFISLVLMA
jgi:ribosomal RNA-processing protein 12